MDYNIAIANVGRKLALGMKKVAHINEDIYELRVLFAKMTPKQKALFKELMKGADEVEAMILAGQIDELSYKVPAVFDENGLSIKTSRLKVTDLPKLSPRSYGALKKIAQDHVKLAIGEIDYKALMENISWFFKMYALDAGQTLIDIMGDEKISPQTRVTAANSILDRGGYRQSENIKAELPVRIVINFPPQIQPQEGEIITEDS